MFQKEYIKDRMLKEVARIWNKNGHINEDSFDPIVNMLVTALSSESEIMYKELGRSESRIADSLMSKLIPNINKGLQPGHTMVLLSVGEPSLSLPLHTELVSHVSSFSEKLEEIHFVTAHDVNLFQGGVVGMYSASSSYSVVDYRFKVEGYISNKEIRNNQLIIDVEYMGDVLDINEIPLFFDLKLTDFKRRLFYESLSRSSFYINEIPVSRKKVLKLNPLIEETDSPLLALENSVIDFYSHQYYLLDLPSHLRNKKRSIDKKNKNTLSITIEFGSLLYPEIVKELFCYVNAVPVINVQKRNKIFKSKSKLPVIHLTQEDSFYCIDSIYSDNGRKYLEYKGEVSNKEQQGAYHIRREGVEGLNGKTANEMIDYLLGILRNETAVLTSVTNGNFANDLKVLKQITAKMEYSLADKTSEYDSVYVFLNEDKVPEYLFVDYYTTKGNEIGGIKINHPLFATKGTVLSQNGNFILSPFVGGRGVLKDEDYINEVRHSLLTNGRIVTSKDVICLVQKYFGKYVDNIMIEKGMLQSSDVNRGYLRTIDVKVKTDGNLNWEECCTIGKIILCELEENGSDIYPYRLIIDKTEVLK